MLTIICFYIIFLYKKVYSIFSLKKINYLLFISFYLFFPYLYPCFLFVCLFYSYVMFDWILDQHVDLISVIMSAKLNYFPQWDLELSNWFLMVFFKRKDSRCVKSLWCKKFSFSVYMSLITPIPFNLICH